MILLGLSGAGKSTVGPIVAEELGIDFFDIDDVVVDRVRMSIPRIFRELGEHRFRQLEGEAVQKILTRADPCVIAPGGGWAAHGDNLVTVGSRALTIYLRTSPTVAAARIAACGGRPLVPRGVEQDALQELLRKRERSYLMADLTVDTDERTPGDVAAVITEVARPSRA